MSQAQQYQHCKPQARTCQPNTGRPYTQRQPKTEMGQMVMDAQKPTIFHPNPFAPHGGALEWCSNELLIHDVDLRRLARVRPLDCGIHDLYLVNPADKL